MDIWKSYEIYANEALDKTGLKNISFDEYPFRREYIISGNTLPNYQIIARVCKERGIEMQTVLQSFANAGGGRYLKRRICEGDMYWQTNLAMGFGVREYAFYTYMPKANIDLQNGGDGIDGACFINNDGSRTALYDYTKRIIREMKKFSKILLKYEYENNYLIFEQGKAKDDFEHTMYAEVNGGCPFPITIDKGVLLVTEQSNGDDKLYMLENIGNVKEELFNGAQPMEIKFSLPNGETTFWQRGEKAVCKRQGEKFVCELKVGEAIFVEVKK